MASDQENANAEAIEALLGHSFQDRDLLIAALTHPSIEDEANYQRLEFFGDRVLGLVIAEAIYEAFPDADEGGLSQRLNTLVCKEALAEVAVGIGLGPLVRMAGAAENAGGRDNPAILADVMEALVGALYMDGGLQPARQAIRSLWAKRLLEAGPAKDAKTRLQEWLQSSAHEAPKYSIIERQGPDHAPLFTVKAKAAGLAAAEGQGSSRQAAEFAAAAALLERLESQGDQG